MTEKNWKILCGNSMEKLKELPDESVDMCVTFPPYYGLRDYGIDGQLGLEETPEEFVDKLSCVFDEVRRVLKKDGTLWVNIGDSYAGGQGRWGGMDNMSDMQKKNVGSLGQIGKFKKWTHNTIKPKDLIGVPWMLAFELRKRGWYLRQDIIWQKPNPMPESVTDRCTKSHEYIFLLSKESKYYFDSESIEEIATGYDGRKDTLLKGSEKYRNANFIPDNDTEESFQSRPHERWKFKESANGVQCPVRNKRDVWNVPTKPYKGAHFATYPEELIFPCIMAGSRVGGVVLDPFNGAGTTGVVCLKTGRKYIGVELNPEYIELSEKRLSETQEQIDAANAQGNFFDEM